MDCSPITMKPAASTASGRNGQSLVELAVAMPVLALILVMALDLSRVFYYYIAIASAAREGARYAAEHPSDTQGIVGRVVGEPADSVALDPSRVAVSSDGTTVQVSVSHVVGAFTPALSAIWNGTISASAAMPVLPGGP